MIRTFLVLALLALLVLPTAAAEVPKQYRGEWCSGKWETIYRRCREGGPDWRFTIGRTSMDEEGGGCETLAFRREYGGHRVWLSCGLDCNDCGSMRVVERWWIGTRGTRLQRLMEQKLP
jgi:hypothetical protein